MMHAYAANSIEEPRPQGNGVSATMPTH